jgi:aminoglycoside 6-adenylyltransferase
MAEADGTLARIAQWAASNPIVRACLLTSTRAVPNAVVDELSDYDVILVLSDIAPFVNDRLWIEEFGEVLVPYWDPIEVDPVSGVEHSGNIVQYTDGLKIDFTLWSIEMLDAIVEKQVLPSELDAGYSVFVDKDGHGDKLPNPTFESYLPKRPGEATYLQLINDFFIGPPYVAKCLVRNELLPAKWCLDYDMRFVYLVPMMEWLAAGDSDWSIPFGVNGKGLRTYFADELWIEFERTFAGADIAANWDALFTMIAFFGRISRNVADQLGFTYPAALEQRVTAFVRDMQQKQFPGELLYPSGP